MNAIAILRRTFVATPLLSAAIYAGIVSTLLLIVIMSIAGILDQQAEVASSTAMLDQLEGRRPAAVGGQRADVSTPSGSVFLEGATVTVASAALIQRVANAVTKFGGNVLSTQVEPAGTPSKAGFVSVLVSCEIEQVGLQPLLYDLEAGMPFLFVDQLVVQSPGASSESGKMRILLTVSGQWLGAK